MYVKFFKRFFDFIFSLIAVVVLSPVLLALIIVGAVLYGVGCFATMNIVIGTITFRPSSW